MFKRVFSTLNYDVVEEVLLEAKSLINEQRHIINDQQEKIDDLQEQINQLKKQLDQSQKNVDFPLFGERMPTPFVFETNASANCPKCGMSWEGTMGYSCPDPFCPIVPNTSSLTGYTLRNDYDDRRARRDNMSSPGDKDYQD